MRKWDRPGVSHDYPPDEWFQSRVGTSFTRLFAVTVIAAGVTDLVVFGFPDTGVPFNYPLPLGVLYLLLTVWALRKFHTVLDSAKIDVANVIERTDLESGFYPRESAISPREIARAVDEELDRAFRPAALVLGGLVGGTFAVALMWHLDGFEYYPYVLTTFLYGAGHGLFYAPIGGTVLLVYRTAENYIVDIDVLDPDGMGGYKRVGDGIVYLINLAIVLVTFDFLVLSSVTFVDEPVFQAAIVLLYVGMLAFLLGFAVWGILRLRRQMLDLRERKTAALREEFTAVEDRYYEKLTNGADPEPESEHIETMITMFDELHGMDLWPINLGAMARIATTTAGSAIVAGFQLDVFGTHTTDFLLRLFGL